MSVTMAADELCYLEGFTASDYFLTDPFLTFLRLVFELVIVCGWLCCSSFCSS